MKRHKHSKLGFRIVLGIGALVASVLCMQCIRSYLYTDAVLIPQQAEREAERQMGALTTAARSAGISDPRALGPVIEHAVEAASERVLWIRVLDPQSQVLAQGGNPQGAAQLPSRWWERVQAHESLGRLIDTRAGRAFVTMLPFRLPPPGHSAAERVRLDATVRVMGAHRPASYIIEVAIPLAAVATAFEGLRQNLIVGVIASMLLLLSLAVLGLRTPGYIRGKYLESELQLARRVQSDLLPPTLSISPCVEFGASAVAADHVGGDFYDIFEAEPGKIAIVLSDASGKGVPAALLASVLQGAIRSSVASNHENACERVNRMLCERTASERFATLFWGVFDPRTNTLRYVNAGHAPPMLVRNKEERIDRLEEGGPVLGLLRGARYSVGTVTVNKSDTLILYSDGISEAANRNGDEFGEERIERSIREAADASPADLCGRIMTQLTDFASATFAPDDRTLLVVKFPQARAARQHETSLREVAVA